MFRITVRPGHPKRQFRRDGRLFLEGTPVFLEELTPGLTREREKATSWLVIEEIPNPEKALSPEELEEATQPEAASDSQLLPVEVPPLRELLRMKKAQLVDLAQRAGIDTSGKPIKSHLIQWLQKKAGRE